MAEVASTILGHDVTVIGGPFKQWICNTCKNSLNKCKVPKSLIDNKRGFQTSIPDLDLHPLKERLISLRIPFM